MNIGPMNTATRQVRRRQRQLREHQAGRRRVQREADRQRAQEEACAVSKLFCPEHGLQDVITKRGRWYELSCRCKRGGAVEPKEESNSMKKPKTLRKRARNYARRRHAACEHGGITTIGKWAKNTLNDGWLVTIPNAQIGDTVPVVNTKGNFSVVQLEKRTATDTYEVRVLKTNGNQKSVLNDSRITASFRPMLTKKPPQRETDPMERPDSADVMLNVEVEELVGLA